MRLMFFAQNEIIHLQTMNETLHTLKPAATGPVELLVKNAPA